MVHYLWFYKQNLDGLIWYNPHFQGKRCSSAVQGHKAMDWQIDSKLNWASCLICYNILILLVPKDDITYSWSILEVWTMMYTKWETNAKGCIRDCFNPPLVTTNTIVQTPSPPIFPSQDIWLLWLIKWSCRTDCRS